MKTKHILLHICLILALPSLIAQVNIEPFSSSIPVDPWNPAWEANQAVQLGYFPVTLVGATPNDDSDDDADAINKAIRIARDHRFVCYFPAGEYVIDKQIKAMIPSHWINNQFRNNREYTPSLVGDPNNGGVIIKVKANSNNFNTTTLGLPTEETIVAAVQLWAQPTTGCRGQDGRPNQNDDQTYTVSEDPNQECQGIGFNLALKNMTIDLNGNSNAVGVRAAGAQGSTIENVTVIATGAYAGFQNGFGEGGGMFNIKVIGGKHGLVITDAEQSLNHHIAGGEFINQEESVFRGTSWAPSSFTGIRIIKEKPSLFSVISYANPAIPNLTTGGLPYRKGLSIIDAVIHITNPEGRTDEVFELWNQNNFYLKNVFIKGVTNLIGWAGNTNAVTSSSPSLYAHIEEFIHTGNTSQDISLLEGDTSILNQTKLGAYVSNPYLGNPIQKHIWQTEPWLDPEQLSDDVIVIDTLAGRDGLADDAILQQAINNAGTSGKIFLPRGIYYINSPLVLKENTQLFGVDKMMTIIMPGPNFPDNAQSFMITTENRAAAQTSLSNIMLKKNMLANQNTSFVHWRAGENSVVRNLIVGATGFATSGAPFHPSRFYQIDNEGGGRWYAVCAEWEKLKVSTEDDDFRMVYINDNQSPLRMYGLNTERNFSDAQVELNNAQDVHIYHFKTEAGKLPGAPPSIPLLIKNSTDIEVHTAYGLVEDNNALPMVKIEQADNTCITITNLASYRSHLDLADLNYNVIETDGSGVSALGPKTILGTYKSCGESILECGLIKNYNFGDGLSYYDTYVHPTTAGIQFDPSADFLQVDQQDGSDLEWKVSFRQDELSIHQGSTYRLSFSAKTDLPRLIKVNVANYQNGFTSYHYQPVNLTTDWVDYEFYFTMSSADDALATLQFGIGGYLNNSTLFRHICLDEMSCPDHLTLDNYQFDIDQHSANIHIESNSLVNTNGNVTYTAGDNILLKVDFEVKPLATFEASIEGCQ